MTETPAAAETPAPPPRPLLERLAASPPVRELLSWSLLGVGAFALLSLASFDAHDYAARAFPVSREPANWGGAWGAALAGFAFDWVGIGASYLGALGTIALGVRLRWAAPARTAREVAALPAPPWAGLAFVRPLGALAVLLGAALVEHLMHRQGAIGGETFPGRNPGGYWGAFLATAILKNFEPGVGYGLGCLAAAVGAALAADLSLGGAAAPLAQAAAPASDPRSSRARVTPAPLSVAVAVPVPAPAPTPAPAPLAAPAPRTSPAPEPTAVSQDEATVEIESVRETIASPTDVRPAAVRAATVRAVAAAEPVPPVVVAPAALAVAAPAERRARKAPRKPVEAPEPIAEAPEPIEAPRGHQEPAEALPAQAPAEPPLEPVWEAPPPTPEGELDGEDAPEPIVAEVARPLPKPAPAPVALKVAIRKPAAPPAAAPPAPPPPPAAPALEVGDEHEHEHEHEPSAAPEPAPARSAASAPPPGPYTLPSLDMLTPSSASPAEAYEALLREKAAVLERALTSFKIDGRVVAVERGPNITQFEIELAAGIKVHRILSLDSDIAMAMKAPNVRIIAPIPGKSTVGVEVPNQDQETVRLRELIESGVHDEKGLALPLFLGKDATGNPLVADLARMPHLLIAGATGSGKSVCMNTVISSILLTRGPSDVKMILIDPKMVELSLYASVPHLLAPVVTDMPKAPAVLEWAVKKMEERYQLLQRAQVRHIKSYNALPPEEISARLQVPVEEFQAAKVPTRLSYIVVVIDEFADLMCVARKEVEQSIIRLAQKSRAVGIHLILATQRPTADVITGLIKSNMPCRIAFQVASKVDSRNILDKNGAESLIGQGDMLFLLPGTSSVIRAQGTYVSDEEVKSIVEHARGAAPQEFQQDLMRAQEAAMAAAEGLADEGEDGGLGAEDGEISGDDPLFDAAVRCVLESKRGSASLLQRRLEVGYGRASRLIDLMTERGVLGPFKGSKARDILLTLAEWDAMKGREAGAAEAA